MADLKQWARETAPTLTDREWESVYAQLWPGLHDREALLAYRDEVAAGLVPPLPLALRRLAREKYVGQVAQLRLRQANPALFDGEITPFGRAVARVLEADRD